MSSMNLSVGIVGLPNVGKSTLFNALLKKQAALAANYPFATIEPNIGIVPVPDYRLEKLAEVIKDEVGMKNFPPIKPALVEFVDIAGLVKGASDGAGLGNKFLSHIREVEIIAHVVRSFEDQEVIREGSIDPKSDYETIQTELILADIQTLEKVNEKSLKTELHKKSAVEKLKIELNQGKSAHSVALTDEEREAVKDLFLLSAKKEVIVLNVTEAEYSEEKIPEIIAQYSELLFPVIPGSIRNPKGVVKNGGDPESHSISSGQASSGRHSGIVGFVVICAKIESELSELSIEDQKQYLADLGLKTSGLERLIHKAYQELGLQSFLTAGEKEVKAWTVKKGSNAPHAAGVIHTDFIKNFIKAEVVSYEDFIALGGLKKAREKGRARMEGRDYIMQEGDVVEFKIGK